MPSTPPQSAARSGSSSGQTGVPGGRAGASSLKDSRSPAPSTPSTPAAGAGMRASPAQPGSGSAAGIRTSPARTPGPTPLRVRQYKAALQRAVRKVVFDLAQAAQRWDTAASQGLDHATQLVNDYLTIDYVRGWPLPSQVAQQPGLAEAARRKLAARALAGAGKVAEAFHALQVAVVDMQAALGEVQEAAAAYGAFTGAALLATPQSAAAVAAPRAAAAPGMPTTPGPTSTMLRDTATPPIAAAGLRASTAATTENLTRVIIFAYLDARSIDRLLQEWVDMYCQELLPKGVAMKQLCSLGALARAHVYDGQCSDDAVVSRDRLSVHLTTWMVEPFLERARLEAIEVQLRDDIRAGGA